MVSHGALHSPCQASTTPQQQTGAKQEPLSLLAGGEVTPKMVYLYLNVMVPHWFGYKYFEFEAEISVMYFGLVSLCTTGPLHDALQIQSLYRSDFLRGLCC